MARDEAILEGVAAGRSPPTLRVYGWRGDWLSIGLEIPLIISQSQNVDASASPMGLSSLSSFGTGNMRFVPKKKRVILGLVTSKKGRLESKDELKRRIDAAAKHIDMDQLSLSPQCGFASTLLGNLLTEEEQYAKLQLVVQTAREVWGNP